MAMMIGGVGDGVLVQYNPVEPRMNEMLDMMKGGNAYHVFVNSASIAVGTVFQSLFRGEDGKIRKNLVWEFIDCNGNRTFHRNFRTRYAATVELLKIWQRQQGHSRTDQQANEALAEGVMAWREWAQGIIGEVPANAPVVQRDLIGYIKNNDDSMREAISKALELR